MALEMSRVRGTVRCHRLRLGGAGNNHRESIPISASVRVGVLERLLTCTGSGNGLSESCIVYSGMGRDIGHRSGSLRG